MRDFRHFNISAVIGEIGTAVAYNILGFNLDDAYAAIRHNAFEPGNPQGHWGRLGLDSCINRGYV